MYLLRIIALPIVPIYYLITWLRNKLYNLGIKKSTSFDLPIICVGNLSVGGTGKTPMIEYLIRLLSSNNQIAILSRGYKRKTKGFVLANKSSNVEMIGDEPYQFYNKFGKDVMVAVDENRVRGVQYLLKGNNKPEIVLLDDAFQHRKIKAGLNILLTTYNNLYVNDYVLPTGNLREPKSGANRANIVVVTKCPEDLSNDQKAIIVQQIKPNIDQTVFFSYIKYSNKIQSADSEFSFDSFTKFTLVTAIANAQPLIDFLNSKSLDFEHLKYKDHHNFSAEEIKVLSNKELILTTEKDYVKLMPYESLKNKLYYLPIEIVIDNKEKFDKIILDFIEKY